MALVEEKVKEEDWELFNSFVPNRKANRHTKWVVDREKNIYFFWTGGEIRESMYEFFMSLDNLKIYIYTRIAKYVQGGMYIWIDRISIPKKISDNNEKKEEIVLLVKEILQIIYNNKVVFQNVEKPVARKGDN